MQKNKANNPENGRPFKPVTLEGSGYFDENMKYFSFDPCFLTANLLTSFRCAGVGLQRSDGSFEFVARPHKRPRSILIKKLRHGRLSKTGDGAIQLTLKVFNREDIDVCRAFLSETLEAIEALSKLPGYHYGRGGRAA